MIKVIACVVNPVELGMGNKMGAEAGMKSLARGAVKSVGAVRAALVAATLAAVAACGGGDDGAVSTAGSCSALKIAGGEECSPAPAAVAIVATNRGYCSGVYITTRQVLTAAHCFPAGVDRVVIGSRGFSNDAVRVNIHPAYDGRVDSPFDIAVVTLPIDAPISPVPLLLSRGIERGDRVVVYGYGFDEKRQDIVERVDNGGAALKATYLDVSRVDPGTVETISAGGDTCKGDSGGSLLLQGNGGVYGITAIVRAGPDICEPDSGLASQNSNTQSQSAVDFILRVAPGTKVI